MPQTDNKYEQIVRDMTQSIYDEERKYIEEDLSKDATWIEASKIAYKFDNDSEFVGTDEEAAKAGLEMMGKFNYNISLGTIPMAVNIEKATDEEKLAFYYMMDAYDKKDISGAGTARFFKNMALDPTTYVGIGSLGWGFAGRQSASTGARLGIKQLLKESAKKYISSTMAVAATEGAMFTSADDLARQNVAVEAGMQEKIDPAQTAIAGTIGAAAGAGLVKGGEMAVKGVKAGAEQIGKLAKEGEQAMMEMAGGGIPHATEYNRLKEPIEIDGKQIGQVTTTRDGNIINIDDIEVSKSRTGKGTETLQSFMQKADDEGLIITLTSDAMRGKESQKKNRELYKKLGFTKNSGKDRIKDTTEEFYYIGKGK